MLVRVSVHVNNHKHVVTDLLTVFHTLKIVHLVSKGMRYKEDPEEGHYWSIIHGMRSAESCGGNGGAPSS